MNRNRVRFLGVLAIFFSFIFLASCSTTQNLDESGGVAKIKLVAASNINPSPSNSASPVVVKIFQLKDDQKFQRADFFGLYLNPKQALGDDYLSEKEVIMAPSEIKSIKLPLNGNAHYLAVLAAYQNIDHAKWYSTQKISTFFGSTSLEITLDHDDITLQ